MREPRKYLSVFKRLERDDEFRSRLVAEHKVERHDVASKSDQVLDAWAWENRKVQRKIVEDVST